MKPQQRKSSIQRQLGRLAYQIKDQVQLNRILTTIPEYKQRLRFFGVVQPLVKFKAEWPYGEQT